MEISTIKDKLQSKDSRPDDVLLSVGNEGFAAMTGMPLVHESARANGLAKLDNAASLEV